MPRLVLIVSIIGRIGEDEAVFVSIVYEPLIGATLTKTIKISNGQKLKSALLIYSWV